MIPTLVEGSTFDKLDAVLVAVVRVKTPHARYLIIAPDNRVAGGFEASSEGI
jgi:hypothetical protein